MIQGNKAETSCYFCQLYECSVKQLREYDNSAVDDTLVLVKPNNVQKVLNILNSFHKNLKFTVDTFPDDIVHFLDIKIDGNKTDVYCKETHTGQYVHFSSFEPWFRKKAWINVWLNVRKRYAVTRNCLKISYPK